MGNTIHTIREFISHSGKVYGGRRIRISDRPLQMVVTYMFTYGFEIFGACRFGVRYVCQPVRKQFGDGALQQEVAGYNS